MEKRKRKPKDEKFQIEFISPFSLEDCISRLPTKVVRQVLSDAYEIELKPNFNDKRNQFINIYAYLERNDSTSTLIVGEGKFSPILYIFAIPVIPFVILGFSGLIRNLIMGLIFVGLVEGFFAYILFRTKKQLTYSVFAAFRPIRKAKNTSKFERWTPLFPWVTLNREVDLPLDECAAQLRKLTFEPTICRIIALDENECHFKISGIFGSWAGLEVVGRIIRESQYGTQIKCRIGMGYAAYGQLFFMIILIAILGINQPVWRGMIPGALVFFTPLIILAGIFNIFMFRRRIIKTLE
ncbi:MAG: hypothetical protein ABI690_26995 [Chloroflexota bacterium]